MFELTINNQIYQFRFGMGFLREANKSVCAPVEGLPGVKKEVGLRYLLARVADGEVDALIELLELGNKGQEPRVPKSELESYVESEDTDIDQLFENVIDFLSSANVTRKTMLDIMKAVEEEKRKLRE